MFTTIKETLTNEVFNPLFTQNSYFFFPLANQTYTLADQLLVFQNGAIDTHCLVYVEEWSGNLTIFDQKLSLSKHDIVFFPFSNGSAWKFVPTKDCCRIRLLIVGGKGAGEFLALSGSSTSILCDTLTSHKANSLFNQIKPISVTCEDILSNSLYINELLTSLALNSISYNKNKDASIPAYVLEAKRMFDLEYDVKYTLEELSAQFHISKFRFIHDFTKFIGTSPITYLNNRRIDAAKELLLYSSERIKLIGFKVGIENTNHFINLFKRETGITPLEYRKEMQKECVAK